MLAALFGSFLGTLVGAAIALFGTWLVVRDARAARKEQIQNQAMSEMTVLLHRGALPDHSTWEERARFAEKFALALLQFPDAARRARMQDSVDLLAFASRDEHYLYDFTRRSGHEIAHLARADLKLCLANRNEKTVPTAAVAWREEVESFRAFEDYVEQDLRRQERGPSPQ
ncbi:hypothetical protein [Streptomyces sp. NPDC055189]